MSPKPVKSGAKAFASVRSPLRNTNRGSYWDPSHDLNAVWTNYAKTQRGLRRLAGENSRSDRLAWNSQVRIAGLSRGFTVTGLVRYQPGCLLAVALLVLPDRLEVAYGREPCLGTDAFETLWRRPQWYQDA